MDQLAPGPIGTAVLVGAFASAAPFTYFARAFRQMGWDVVEVEVERYLSPLGNHLFHTVIDRLLPKSRTRIIGEEIVRQCQAGAADVVVFAKGMGATPALLQRLAAMGVRTVNWYPDVHFSHPVVDQDCIPMFDVFVTTKAFQIPYLERLRGNKPSILIEHGYCPDVHRPNPLTITPAERPFDCVFVGNHSPYKEEMLRKIVMQANVGNSFGIVGHRWEGRKVGPDAQVSFSNGLTGDLMSRSFHNARIAIAIHHGPGSDGSGWEDDVSARTFEIPACGTFMLHIDSPHLRTLFDVPNEIGVFTDAASAAERIAHFLAKPDERESMAARAHSRALSSFSYVDRGLDMVNAIAPLITAPLITSPAAKDAPCD